MPMRGSQAGQGVTQETDASKTIEAELLLLRKGIGFTAARLAKAPVLTHVLGGREQTFEMARERFVSAIQSLRSPADELLLTVFGLREDAAHLTTLRERRRLYGNSIGRGVETVADLEPSALAQLRLQLITGWYPKSPLPVRVPESHNGLIQESVSVRTVVRDRLWVETRERYRFFAAFDEAQYLTISTSHPGRPEPEGDFTVRTKRIGNSFSHQFWHATPMRRGNFYDLRFRLVPDEDPGADSRPVIEESKAFHEPTRYASFEIVFEGEVPQIVWQYDRLTFFERPGEPTRDRLLSPRGAGVAARFTDLYGGLFNGIAWQW